MPFGDLEVLETVSEVKETRLVKLFGTAKKEDVITEIFKQANYSKQFAEISLNITLGAITELLAQGSEIEIENVGSFRKAIDSDGKQVFLFKPAVSPVTN